MSPKSLTPVFPFGKTPSYTDAPMCCGSLIFHFPSKLGKRKISEVFDTFDHEDMMIIVLGKAFPKKIIREVCSGVGVLDIKKCGGHRYNTVVSIGRDESSYDEFKIKELDRSVEITRLTKTVFLLEGLYQMTEPRIKGIKKLFEKGDVVLAISTNYLLSEKKLLSKHGFKVVKSMMNPNSDARLFLHRWKC